MGVFTNKMPTDAIRGAGRPEATHLLEVMMDQLAAEMGMDRLELRRKNFIPPEDFPADVPSGIVYDSGNYAGHARQAPRERRPGRVRGRAAEELRKQGRYRGIGFSTWVEISGLAPSRAVGPRGMGIQAGLWESAVVRMHPDGTGRSSPATSPHGQGLDTRFQGGRGPPGDRPADEVE